MKVKEDVGLSHAPLFPLFSSSIYLSGFFSLDLSPFLSLSLSLLGVNKSSPDDVDMNSLLTCYSDLLVQLVQDKIQRL